MTAATSQVLTTGRRSIKAVLIMLFVAILAGIDPSYCGALPLKLQPIEGKILLGVFEPPSRAGKSSFERVIGRRVALVNSFQAWGASDREFSNWWVDWAKALGSHNQVLMITWEPWEPGNGFDQVDYRLSTIIEGKHDGYMKRWFSQVRDLRQPIFVRFAHEMNGGWYPWGTQVNKPREYVMAWRHVVDLSREVGADNITWVWAPNVHMAGDHLRRRYPGNDYVDWIGISGYNWGGPGRDWTGWSSAKEIFSPTLALIKKYKKPIMIAETGAVEKPQARAPAGKTKAKWIKATYNYLKNADPPISLVSYQNEGAGTGYDWRVTTSRASRRAIRRAASDTRFMGKFR